MSFRIARIFAASCGLIALLTCPIFAHPMGNLSISHGVDIHVERDGLRVRYRVDFAEVPSVEEMRLLDANGDGKTSDDERKNYLLKKVAKLTGGLHLSVNDAPAALKLFASDLKIRPGAGDLPTVQLMLDYKIPAEGWKETNRVDYHDANFAGRVSWEDVWVLPGDGCLLIPANTSDVDPHQPLYISPGERVDAVPQDWSATFTFKIANTGEKVSASDSSASKADDATASRGKENTPQSDRLTALITRTNLSPALVFLSLAIAFAMGAFHALAPGHGKTVMAAYLVGSRGTPAHACILGAMVTITHTAGVFALGLVVLFASKQFMPDTIYPWLGFISGMMIFSIGGWQLMRRYARAHSPDAAVIDVHGPGGHTHALPEHITLPGLIVLGISGGMVPCPSALILILSAIALHRVGFGLILTVAFSLGLACVLISIGMLLLYAQRVIERLQWKTEMFRRLPLVSSAIIAVLGLTIAARSLISGGIIQIGR